MDKKPICFIAMAFDHQDTDQVYANLIRTVLKRNGITPIIINRRQSNDDLNVQIIEQLEKADFCIADLTYTRPLVYFEAGFAQRSIPVIYTVRQDHLGSGQPEELRVHFDLQMKPLIVWKSPNDNSFSTKLEKRLRSTILRQWKINNNQQLKNELEKQQFNTLPLLLRLRRLRRQAVFALRRVGIKSSSLRVERELNHLYFENEITPRKSIYNGHYNYISGATVKGRKLLHVSIMAFESVKQSDLQTIKNVYLSVYYFINKYSPESWEKIDEIFSNIIIMSLKSLSASQIERNFEHCAPLERAKTYVIKGRFTGRDDHEVKTTFTIHFLSGIESFSHSKSLLDNEVIEQLAKELKGS